jgi:hypothetical protein
MDRVSESRHFLSLPLRRRGAGRELQYVHPSVPAPRFRHATNTRFAASSAARDANSSSHGPISGLPVHRATFRPHPPPPSPTRNKHPLSRFVGGAGCELQVARAHLRFAGSPCDIPSGLPHHRVRHATNTRFPASSVVRDANSRSHGPMSSLPVHRATFRPHPTPPSPTCDQCSATCPPACRRQAGGR